MFRKVLVANRGEVAVRILRACRDLGVQGVAVYSEVDRGALHVRLADEAYLCGPARASESYLVGERIIDIALACGADAIHPGYGFLSENGDFAEHCAARGVSFIGPSAAVIRTMGDKVSARRCVAGVGIPAVPGSTRRLADDEMAQAAHEIGYPVMLKASAGGGGKGMRLVSNAGELAKALERARGEALSSFGDDGVYLEKYLDQTRHVEVQILADAHGNTLHLFERDCSLQRRHQKVFEEAPAVGLSAKRREAMASAAVTIAEAVDYVGVGTCEFLLHEDNCYFLEMNTRLQVEHAVTEAITGVDLVEQQLRIAAGEPLALRQEDVRPQGHAIEARIYAEDPDKKFAPSPGTLGAYRPADGIGIRVDGGVETGDEVTAFYDPMLAKLIAWGVDRDQCLARLRRALDEFAIDGVKTSLPLHRGLVRHPSVECAAYDTDFVDRELTAVLSAAPCLDEAEQLCCVLAGITVAREETALPSLWRVSQRHGESFRVQVDSREGSLYRGVVGRDADEPGDRVAGSLNAERWELDVFESPGAPLSVLRGAAHCEAAIGATVRKGVRHVDVSIPGRRMRLIVEELKIQE
jgi:acetyl-CoA carboxylase biotin carboxylase subunit